MGRSLSPPATRADGHIGARLPTFHAEAADQARVAFMPDTTWPVSGHPPGSSRSSEDSPGFDVVSTFSTPQQRSPSWSPPDTSTGAFSTSLTTTVFSQRSMWWFEASPRRAAPKGQTFISHAAPHQEALPTSSSPPRSWHTSSRTCSRVACSQHTSVSQAVKAARSAEHPTGGANGWRGRVAGD